MTAHLALIYGFAALTVAMLGIFARQNQKSGWKRHRANSISEGLQKFYADLGFANEEETQIAPAVWQPVTSQEAAAFSSQILNLRAALGVSATVSHERLVAEEVFVRRD